ncbi:MAG: ABC transporter ATP-binding protein, partial [Alphaproteobacteria bacterium]|nr:ABC transporter ATP-binding protein [Alphaproteobacteria bacterium]
MIDARNLSITFGMGSSAVHAVQKVSFSVKQGESYGIVGESGSGKSTILRALAGLNRDWSGELRVKDVILSRKRSINFYRGLQMVFQDPYGSLHPRHTVNDILNEPLIIHKFSDRERRINQALKEVGLGPDYRFRFPHQLSGGQRQRISIARAVIISPSILLLDEPTSALDVSVQAEILNLLQGMRAAHNLTYILVSHNLSVVAHMCDRLAIMNAGKIVEELDVKHL